MANIRFLTGAKDNIDAKIAEGLIDAGDIVLTSDTDELIFYSPKREKKTIHSKTQQAYQLNGTSLGALSDGDTIEAGTSIDDLLRLITQKAIPAVYTKPTVSISSVAGLASGNYEAGTPITATIQSAFTQNDAGPVTFHNLLKNDEIIHEGGAVATLSFNNPEFILGDETIVLKSEVGYQDGPIKPDNLGNDSYENAILAGSIESQHEIKFSGQRNMFYGVGVGELPELNSANIRALGNAKLNPVQGYSWNIPLEVGQQYVIFAYPSTLRDVNQIMYVEANDTSMASSFDKTLIEVEGANGYSAKEYKVYSYKMASPIAAPMTFKITI